MIDDSGRNDGIADMINLIAAPIAGGIRTVDQMRRGVDELFRTIDNLNRTLENLNEAAARVNSLMADVEEPVRAMIPQLTRTIKTADEITSRLERPVRMAAPNLEQVASTLSSPGFASLPNQIGEIAAMFGEISRRLGPLTQFAENAGGLFGGFKLPGMTGGRPAARPSSSEHPVAEPEATVESAAKKSAAKKSGARKSAAKKSAAKKSGARKSGAKKSGAKKPSEG